MFSVCRRMYERVCRIVEGVTCISDTGCGDGVVGVECITRRL